MQEPADRRPEHVEQGHVERGRAPVVLPQPRRCAQRGEDVPVGLECALRSREKDTAAWCSDGLSRRHNRSVEVSSTEIRDAFGGVVGPVRGVGAQADEDLPGDCGARLAHQVVDDVMVDDVDQRDVAGGDSLGRRGLPHRPMEHAASAFDSVRFHTVVR